jgi:hypothetical protein
MSGQHVDIGPRTTGSRATRITVRAALDGVPMDRNRYGDTDRRAAVSITTNRTELFVDNATKQMTVMQNGAQARQIPVSLGKPSNRRRAARW